MFTDLGNLLELQIYLNHVMTSLEAGIFDSLHSLTEMYVPDDLITTFIRPLGLLSKRYQRDRGGEKKKSNCKLKPRHILHRVGQ